MGRATLLLLALGIGGCVHLPWQKDEITASHEAEEPMRHPRRSVRKVTADQINEKNAPAMAQALVNELDHAEDPSDPPPPPAKKK